MSDDREKPSWRDRDNKKDRSSHVRADSPAGKPKQAPPSGMSRAQADKLFASGTLADVYEKKFGEDTSAEGTRLAALRELKKADGGPRFVKALRAYIKAHGFPPDLDVARRAVEVDDIDLVRGGLRALCDYAQRTELPRTAALKVHLETLLMVYEGSDIEGLVAALRAHL